MNMLRVPNKEASSLFAYPLKQSLILRTLNQRLYTVQGIWCATTRFTGSFTPLIYHGQRQAHVIGNLFGTAILEHISQELM